MIARCFSLFVRSSLFNSPLLLSRSYKTHSADLLSHHGLNIHEYLHREVGVAAIIKCSLCNQNDPLPVYDNTVKGNQ